MGMSAAQGRLLSITARLTSNEYESQQISNAKMRLSTQSEEASAEYIAALNSQQLQYVTYDAKGNQTTQKLSVGAMYQYNDMKNQYIVSNSAGQALISGEDAEKFQNANNLDEFLQLYGLKKQWKTSTLEENYNKLQSEEFKAIEAEWNAEKEKYSQAEFDSTTGEMYIAKYDEEKKLIGYLDKDGNLYTADQDDTNKRTFSFTKDGKKTSFDSQNLISSEQQWANEKSSASREYSFALAKYQELQDKAANGLDVTSELKSTRDAAATAKAKYTSCISKDNWLTARVSYPYTGMSSSTNEAGEEEYSYSYDFNNASDICNKMSDYDTVVAEFNSEAADYGTNMEDLYTYEDQSKAQWYTNLWYRLNGSSTEKSKQGEHGQNYTKIDSKLLSSTTWLQDAILQGAVTVEIASTKNPSSKINENNPTVSNLTGISWSSTIYTSCTDFTQSDDDQAIARAEAEYERKTKEISDKDQKYQNKIKLLETEHSSLQTEYESVQSAMNKNIERSFKVFS